MRIIISHDICDDVRFAYWLVEEIRQELVFICDEKELEAIGKHISDKLEIDLNMYDVFLKILNSIKVLEGNRIVQIVISNKVLYRDIRITTASMAKLIDIGNIEIRGTHIFSIVFNRIRSNIKKYLTKYLFENGVI